MTTEVIDLTASQPDGLPQPDTSGRRQRAALGLDLLAASPRAAAHNCQRQRRPAEPLIDLTGDDDDGENWHLRAAKRHRAERQRHQQQPQRELWEGGGLDAGRAAAARMPQPLQQRFQGAQHLLQQPHYSPKLPEKQEQEQQQQQQQPASPLVQQRQEQRPESPPVQHQKRQQNVQQEAAVQEEVRAQQRCDICFDDEIAPAFMHTFASCKHSFCMPCLREYISGKVQDRTFPVPCPLPDCKAPISAAECGLVLTIEEAATLGKMEAEAAIGEGARLFCPNPQCSMLLLNDDKQADVPIECPYCQQQLCANCAVAWHKGMTCQQYQAQPGALRSKEDQALLDLADQEGMRRCPACGVMVQRTQGCSFMRCRCGTHFCYGCGKRKDKGSNHFCGCKPHQEQWANAPPAVAAHALPAVAARLLQHADVHLRQFPFQQHQEALRRAQEEIEAHAARVQAFMLERQRQRRARRGAEGQPAGNQQQQAQQQGPAAAAGAAAGVAIAMQVPPLHAGLPGAGAPLPRAVPANWPLPVPVDGARAGVPPGLEQPQRLTENMHRPRGQFGGR